MAWTAQHYRLLSCRLGPIRFPDHPALASLAYSSLLVILWLPTTVVKTDTCQNGEWYQHVLPVLTYLFAFHIIILFKPKMNHKYGWAMKPVVRKLPDMQIRIQKQNILVLNLYLKKWFQRYNNDYLLLTNNKGHYDIPSAGLLKMKRNIESIIKESRFLLRVDSKALEHHLFV